MVDRFNNPEKIVCSAIWYPDEESPVHTCSNIEKGVVLCGLRHPYILGQFKSLTGKKTPTVKSIQGFLTSCNRFVGREEALIIALAQNQVMDIKDVRGDILHSEDLY